MTEHGFIDIAGATEISARADFSRIRYAQCWEDADLLIAGLQITPDDRCLSIASAGDNSLSLLSQGPKSVAAVDLNPVQLHCLELRIGAYRHLDHAGLLELMGSRDSDNRRALYRAARRDLSPAARIFWDGKEADLVRLGLGGFGKFEHYLSLFRRYVLPLTQSPRTVAALMQPKTPAERETFFAGHWQNRRWRFLTGLFFSRAVMGRLGRDPAFFTYVEGGMAAHIARRVRHALVTLDPSNNPYLHWILTGRHGAALPHALREAHFAAIRRYSDRLSLHAMSTDGFLRRARISGERISRFNLSNIFEYMSEPQFDATFRGLIAMADEGARFAYWNMRVPRRASAHIEEIEHLPDLSAALYRADKAFFYSDFVVEQLGRGAPA